MKTNAEVYQKWSAVRKSGGRAETASKREKENLVGGRGSKTGGAGAAALDSIPEAAVCTCLSRIFEMGTESEPNVNMFV